MAAILKIYIEHERPIDSKLVWIQVKLGPLILKITFTNLKENMVITLDELYSIVCKTLGDSRMCCYMYDNQIKNGIIVNKYI